MNCTNPNCECKPGTYANLNPPRTFVVTTRVVTTPLWFTRDMIDGIEWQEKRSLNTTSGEYRVEITWALDRYRVSVYRRVQEPEKLIEVRHPLYARTAIETANKLVRGYNRREF